MPEAQDQQKVDDLIDVGETVGAEINLDDKGEPEKIESPVEEKIEVEKVEEQPVEDKTFENETKIKVKSEENKDELKEYSDGVQKRIAKLTRKMREAERQKEEAIAFAEAVNKQKEETETRLSKLDKSYVSEFESRVTSNLSAAKQALKTAIEAQDVDGQVKAQEQIARGEDVDINKLGAVATGLTQSAVERAALGFSGVSKLLGINLAKNVTKEAAKEATEKTARESLKKALAVGTGKFVLAEGSTEIVQQVLERYYAGLPLTNDDAKLEYAEAAYGATLLFPLGIGSRISTRSRARDEIKAEEEQIIEDSNVALATLLPNIISFHDSCHTSVCISHIEIFFL